jgi:GNAT superfamily N-acetyltransferase
MIRRARTPADFAAVDLLQATILPYDKPLRTNVGAWWLAWDDGEPVAFAGVRPSLRWIDCMYLCRSGVAPEHRGKGVQKRLIRVREAYAREMAMRWLISDTTNNPASANSLISCGFRMYEPAAPWGNRHTVYWKKRI